MPSLIMRDRVTRIPSAGPLNHLSRLRFSTEMLHNTRKNTGMKLNASAATTSLVRMREPSRLLRRSTYSFTAVRNSMKPSVTVNRKTSVETAQ